MPAEVFFFLSQGLVSPQVIQNVLSGFVLESAPLADSASYHKIVDNLLQKQRAPAITTLRACLNRHFQTKRIDVGLWHLGEPTEFPLPGSTQQQQHISLDDLPFLRYHFSMEDMVVHMAKYSKEIDPYFCLHWVEDTSAANPPSFIRSETADLSQLGGQDCGDQVSCYITLSVLQVHGYLTEDHTISPPRPRLVLSPFGHAALTFSPRFTVEGMRVLSLVMMGEINGQPLDRSDDADSMLEVRLLSRVFAILPMRFNGSAWDDRVDPDLIRFNSTVNRMRLEWSNLVEMLLLHIACRRPKGLHFSAYREQIRQIRGPGEQSCALGIVAKYILTTDPTTEVNKNTLQTVFGACENPVADLKDGCVFWGEVMNCLLYTSDAADEEDSVDLGGRRIIKKKKQRE
eukprot:TRINITY_DN16397_c0_g1_i2.p1 TRINITY_DN16397_c0_g1~~TRINITY_DN16397_c0_g1_i2.p1  ORF type:complete len:401 (-),score=107.19 TRINITY_DN16397_c0_g1_i2:111-1313(-)